MKLPSGVIAIDTETTGLLPWKGDRPFIFTGCWEDGRTKYVRFPVNPFTREVDYAPVRDGGAFFQWQTLLEDPSITKVFHNAKFDVRMFEMVGIKVAGRIEDTMFAMHVLNNTESSLGLKDIAKRYLDIPKDDETDLHKATVRARRQGKKLGWKLAQKNFPKDDPVKADYWMAPEELSKKYAITDVERTIQLWLFLSEQLKEEGLWDVYQSEMELWPVTYRMETHGIRVDPAVIEREIAANVTKAKELRAQIDKYKPGLNVDSPVQMSNYIYKELGNECRVFTDKGNPSVSFDALKLIEHPIVKTIAQFKAAEDANTNFFFKYKQAMVQESPGIWILHPDFNQIGPVTGRYSCRNPNIQNAANALGTRSENPIQARTPFGPRPGYIWYHFDFSQIEMWIFAALAKEEHMLNALIGGHDIHGETAARIWGKEILEKEKAEGRKTTRNKAKLINFGIIYGIGAESLAALTKTTKEQARADLNAYKNAFPRIADYMERLIREAEDKGYIVGPMGRRWRIWPGRAYVAVNYMVQGSAAQVIKKVMVDVDRFFTGKPAHLIATIHDEHIDAIKRGFDTWSFIRKIQKLSENNGHPFGLDRLPVEVARTVTCWRDKEEVVM